MKNKINQWFASLTEWRRLYLFTTPTESNALVEAALMSGSEIQNKLLAGQRQAANEAEQRARDLFLSLQDIKVNVNGSIQLLEIKLSLNYKSLGHVDVTTASEILAGKTCTLYREALQKRLGNKNQQIDTAKKP